MIWKALWLLSIAVEIKVKMKVKIKVSGRPRTLNRSASTAGPKPNRNRLLLPPRSNALPFRNNPKLSPRVPCLQLRRLMERVRG